jgi:predicted enzyme related to lactoylglutathione lyase
VTSVSTDDGSAGGRPTSQHLAHFAINADDVDVARTFYAGVFGWNFEPWGPPGFCHIKTGSGELPGPIGALQQRRELVPGEVTHGFECTVAVDDVVACLEEVRRLGGRVLMEPAVIPGVGEIGFFADPSGNVCGAMRYEGSGS